MTQRTRQQIDQLLLEQGEYRPLDYLLHEGRLDMADYEAWRIGEIDLLDQALFGDPEQIQQQLQEADDYLSQLGWEMVTLEYSHWGHPGSPLLCFSNHTLLNTLFHQSYRKPADRTQLDLFFDTTETALANDITRSLLRCDAANARTALERLGDQVPDHVHLGELERLVEALESLADPVADLETELRTLQHQLTPLAQGRLGREHQNLLIPLWKRLADALSEQPFLPAQPDLHQSHAAIQARDWMLARHAVEHETDWQEHPLLLMRHALACEHLHQPADALNSWFILCWHFPDWIESVQSTSNGELRKQWMNFRELEPELPAPDFPAWLLIASPRLIQQAPDPGLKGGRKPSFPPSYAILYRLTTDRSIDRETLGLRAELQRQSPLLLHHLLGAISSER